MDSFIGKRRIVAALEDLQAKDTLDALGQLTKLVEAWNQTPWGEEGWNEDLAHRFYVACKEIKRRYGSASSPKPVVMGTALRR